MNKTLKVSIIVGSVCLTLLIAFFIVMSWGQSFTKNNELYEVYDINKQYSQLKGENFVLNLQWDDISCHALPGYTSHSIYATITPSFPIDVMKLADNFKKVQCKFYLDGEYKIQTRHELQIKGFLIDSANKYENHLIKACCFGDWEKYQAYDACIEETIEARCEKNSV